MKEQPISFETAKLAKEKGFDSEDGTAWYVDTILAGHNPLELQTNLGEVYTWKSERIYEAPTQSVLQKWLRDVYGYYVIIIPTITINWTFKIINIMKKDSMEIPPYTDVSGEDFSIYEEALEKGLQEALKLV
jgi:hypothetical protein